MVLNKFTGSTLMDGNEDDLFKIFGNTMKHFASYVYLKALQVGDSIRIRVYDKVDDVSRYKLDGDVNDSVGSNNGTITNIPSWISQWKFDGNVNDSIGSNNGTITYHSNLKSLFKFEGNVNATVGNNGTVTGNTNFVTGREGQAFSFDGSSYITASDTGLQTGNGTWSITGWIYPKTVTTKQEIYQWGTIASNEAIEILTTTTGKIQINNMTSILLTSNTVLSVNTWYHFEITYDGTTLTLYINGVSDNTATPSALNITLGGATAQTIGKSNGTTGTSDFSGYMDELRNYNIALSQAQVSALYMNGKFGQSHTFDGGEYITNSSPTGLVSGNNGFSISAWVYNTDFSSGDNTYISYGTASAGQAVILNINSSGKVVVGKYSSDLLTSATILSKNIWTHIVVTYDGTTLKLFFNGVQDANTATPTFGTVIGSLAIGNLIGGGQLFNGQLDEIRYYNTALTASQVLGLYNYTGSNYVTPLPVGNALSLDGSSYVTIPNQTPYNFERTNSFSISGWIKTTSNTLGIITKDNGDGTKGYQINLNASGKITVRIVNTASTNEIQVTDSGAAINDGNFHNFVLTYSGTSLASGVSLYIDGVSRTLTTNTNNLSATIQNTNNVIIGANGDTSSKFTGLIDEVQIFNYVVSSAEINAINAGRFANTHPIGLWHFDGDLYDYSGQGSTGSPTGTMLYETGALSGSYNVPNTHFNFDGSEYIKTSSNFSLTLTQIQPFTVSAWLKFPDLSSVPEFLTLVNSSGNGILCFVDASGHLSIQFRWASGGSGATFNGSTTTLSDKNWHFITITYDGSMKLSGVNLYVDGVLDSTGSSTSIGSFTATDKVYIGIDSNTTSDIMVGEMDDLRFITRALSSAEVLDLFNYPDSPMKELIYDRTYSGVKTDAIYVPMLQGNQYKVTCQQTLGTNRIIPWERFEVT